MYETHVTVQGRLVADPVVKQARDGAARTTFRVAQSERHPVRSDPGQWADSDPSYYDVSVFRAFGTNAARSLRKGHPVVVHGKLRARGFQRDDGSFGTAVEIEAYSLGHDLRWGCTQFTRNGDLAPTLPEARGAADVVGDPARDPYELAAGPPPGEQAEPTPADSGPLVPPPGERAA
jgi:single-strand DNA-binding protein